MESWGFYGREQQEEELQKIAKRGRWFFCQISGRRRIGKTTLINRLLQRTKNKKIFYVQIPDSDPSGVLQAANDALEDFEVSAAMYPRPTHLQEFAKLLGKMTEREYFVVLDEFQYFHRKPLYDFCSYLQTEVDRLSQHKSATGGLFVLGSIHNEMMAVLEDRRSPLFNRVTDRLIIEYLDFKTLRELWSAHGIQNPYQQLFLWTLFEGVPKFYRDCFEQDILKPMQNYREKTLETLFFKGSSPLRNEADSWFLNEFRGRYESLLKIVAANNGCPHARIMEEYRKIQPQEDKQIGGYLNTLVNKYQMIGKRLPVFATKGASRQTRYYIADNFLLSWLGAIDRQIKASRVKPLDSCIAACASRLEIIEGIAFEKMIRLIMEELSRAGDPDFQLTAQVTGYWNRPDEIDRSIEIDHISYNEEQGWARFGSCKRSGERLMENIGRFKKHVAEFLKTKEGKRMAELKPRMAAFAPRLESEQRAELASQGFETFGFDELLERIGSG